MTNEEVIAKLSEAIAPTFEQWGKVDSKNALVKLLCNRDYAFFTFKEMEKAADLADSWDELLDAVCDMYLGKLLTEKPINLGEVSLESKLVRDENAIKDKVLQRLIKGEYVPGYTNDYELEKKRYELGFESLAKYVTYVVADEVLDDIVHHEKKNDPFLPNIEATPEVSNVELYPENLEKARNYFSIDGHGFSPINQGWGQVGKELFLASRICKRKNQEDAGIIMVHPSNPKFKLMVVADGMGGHSGGETASATVISQIKDWFEKEVDPEYYEKPEALQEMLKEKILEISKTIDSEARQGRNRMREKDRPRNNILWCYCGKR